jgi:hypothetical protein
MTHITIEKAKLEKVLEALKTWVKNFPSVIDDLDKQAVADLEQALAAQPAPELVAAMAQILGDRLAKEQAVYLSMETAKSFAKSMLAAAQPAVQDATSEALQDCKSHYQAWRGALTDMQHSSKEEGDISYWRHEIAAFDRTFKALNDQPAAPVQPVREPVAQAWDEGYRAGIDDERTSEASIGIAGFDAKVEPARNNPYRTTSPAQPAVQEPAGEAKHMNGVSAAHTQAIFLKSEVPVGTLLYTTPPAAQPAIPDAIHHTDMSKTLEYIQGWNACRQATLEMMK